jgi:phosphatidate cytidylyltransferase
MARRSYRRGASGDGQRAARPAPAPTPRTPSATSGTGRGGARDGGRGRPPPGDRARPAPPPPRKGGELGARILVAVPAIAVALFLVVEGGVIFMVGLIALGVVCLHELYAMYEGTHPVRLAGFLGLAGLLLAAQYGSGQRQIVLAAVAFVPLLFALTLAQREHSALGLALTLFGVFWVGLAFAHAILLRRLPHGDGIVIDVLVGTFVGDTGAYIGGRLFGTHKLAPRLSPNKTVEGLVIGMVFATLGTWFAGRYQSWLPSGHSLVLGLGVALAAPIGDLFESFIKRDAGTKDTGRLFGAHGGALDRLDAVLFTAVVGYYIWAAYT